MFNTRLLEYGATVMAVAREGIVKYWKALAKVSNGITARDIRVIYKRNGLLAISKPYGLPVMDGPGMKISLASLLPEIGKYHGLPETPQLCHRIDKNCSGILFLSYNYDVAVKIANMFANREMRKEYLAVVLGQPDYKFGSVDIPICEGLVGKQRRMVLRSDLIGKTASELKELRVSKAVTKFSTLDSNNKLCSLLRLTTHSGYKHQIRLHLADGLETPILGDHKYTIGPIKPQRVPLRLMQMLDMIGVRSATRPNGKIQPWQRASIPLHLFAESITLNHIDEKPLIIRDKLPEYFKHTLDCFELHPKQRSINQNKYNVMGLM